jgi:hypothetical protein
MLKIVPWLRFHRSKMYGLNHVVVDIDRFLEQESVVSSLARKFKNPNKMGLLGV